LKGGGSLLGVTISALKTFPDQLEQFFQAIPKEYLQWTPASWEGIPSEKFTILEQLCHVRDIELEGYQVRFRRLLEEVDPTLISVDGYALVSRYRYAEADPAEVLRQIQSARSRTVEMISNLNESQLNRTGFFEDYGTVTLKGLIHYLCSHDQQHLAGMQWLLGQIESRPTG
jgi:hypothetical protein